MYRCVNFPFLLLGYFPVQAPFPMPCSHSQIFCWQPKPEHWAAAPASASEPFPQPFPRQAGKEPEAPTQPTLLENQISDKKALSWGTNMKISSFGYFWLLWSPSPGSRCVCREPRSCVMAGICGVPNASKCMWAQVGGGIALICMHVFVWIDLLHPTSYLNTKQGPQLLAASLCLLFPGSLSPAGKWKENFNVGEAKFWTNLFGTISGWPKYNYTVCWASQMPGEAQEN